MELGGHRRETFATADLIVTSPGVPSRSRFSWKLAREASKSSASWSSPLAGCVVRVIAMTGTKGKSTTTTLIARMVAAEGRHVLVGGNIGVPLSLQVDDSTPETIHAVEVSSFQLETTTTFRPWIALWLNLADDHLDRHPSVEEYATAKARSLRISVPGLGSRERR